MRLPCIIFAFVALPPRQGTGLSGCHIRVWHAAPNNSMAFRVRVTARRRQPHRSPIHVATCGTVDSVSKG